MDEPVHIYEVRTPAIPEGFPVAVVNTGEGAKVNWENFINFHDDLFRKFTEGPPGTSGVFHVYVKPETPAPGDAESHFVRFRLSVPMPGREHTAFIRKDSVSLAVLKSNFEGSGEWNKEQADLMLKGTGGPATLKLSKRKTNDERSYIEIDELVGIGWKPAGK